MGCTLILGMSLGSDAINRVVKGKACAKKVPSTAARGIVCGCVIANCHVFCERRDTCANRHMAASGAGDLSIHTPRHNATECRIQLTQPAQRTAGPNTPGSCEAEASVQPMQALIAPPTSPPAPSSQPSALGPACCRLPAARARKRKRSAHKRARPSNVCFAEGLQFCRPEGRQGGVLIWDLPLGDEGRLEAAGPGL